MISLRWLRDAMVKRLEIETTVRIDECYHFRGFRYGGYRNNPYEDYIVGLSNETSKSELRREFAEAILRHPPRTMDDALQISLGAWPIWEFPWNPPPKRPHPPLRDPSQNPDVVCHFCSAGVLSSHINREFMWLESAFDSVRRMGYQPQSRGYITCLQLAGESRSSYLVLDGNHRLSALHAIGETTVRVKVARHRKVRRIDAPGWPRVCDGSLSLPLALQIFDRYFWRDNPPMRSMQETNPAHLVVDEPPLWPLSGDGDERASTSANVAVPVERAP